MDSGGKVFGKLTMSVLKEGGEHVEPETVTADIWLDVDGQPTTDPARIAELQAMLEAQTREDV